MRIHHGYKQIGIGKHISHGIVISTDALHHGSGIPIQGSQVIGQLFQGLGSVKNVKVFPEKLASKLKNNEGALPFGNINSNCFVHSNMHPKIRTSITHSLFHLLGYQIDMYEDSQTCINRTAAKNRLSGLFLTDT